MPDGGPHWNADVYEEAFADKGGTQLNNEGNPTVVTCLGVRRMMENINWQIGNILVENSVPAQCLSSLRSAMTLAGDEPASLGFGCARKLTATATKDAKAPRRQLWQLFTLAAS